ncbi:MAG TPA: ribonuclease H [Gemmatimonadaceae bacterium]|nr:ribonuclease H [Gemmatimonadaceae bacterium]
MVAHSPIVDAPLVALYADESCLGNGRDGENPGGAGVLAEFRRATGELVRRDLWLSAPATTNNQMALRSVIEPFRALSKKGQPCRVVFTTDSRYLVDGMTRWVHDWARRQWKRKMGAIENLALWREAIDAARPFAVQWRWVRGHAGHAQNEYANHLAISAARTLEASHGFRESGFEEWLAAGGATRRALVPDPFPDPAAFRAAAALPASGTASP